MEQPIDILIVEANPTDLELTRRTLERSKLRNRISVVKDGEEALRFLRQQDEHRTACRPDLVLLDLNLPKASGRQVLAEVRNDRALRRIPVVILTSSVAELDVVQSYDLGANCYVTKPLDVKLFEEIIEQIEDSWLSAVRLPPD